MRALPVPPRFSPQNKTRLLAFVPGWDFTVSSRYQVISTINRSSCPLLSWCHPLELIGLPVGYTLFLGWMRKHFDRPRSVVGEPPFVPLQLPLRRVAPPSMDPLKHPSATVLLPVCTGCLLKVKVSAMVMYRDTALAQPTPGLRRWTL